LRADGRLVQIDHVGAPPKACNPLVHHHPLLIRSVGCKSLIEVGSNAEILTQQLTNIVAVDSEPRQGRLKRLG